MRLGLYLLGLGLLVGCGAVDREPLDPVAMEAGFRARTLSDPGLREYLRTHGVAAEPWTLEALTLAAFYYHPDLDLARARLERARAGSRTAAAWPNPVLGLEGGRTLHADSGVSPWLYGLDLRLSVDELWKRGHRIEAAERLGDAAGLALLEVAWQVRSRLRTALARHLLSAREVDLRRTEWDLRATSVSVTERKLALGEAFILDVSAARSELAGARAALAAAESRLVASRLELAAAIGIPGSALEGVSPAWPEIDRPPAESATGTLRTAGLLNRLDVRRGLAEYEAAEALLQLEVAKRYPDLSFGPSYEFEEGERRFRLGMSITLPIFDQNQGPIAEAMARRKEAGAQVLATQARVIGELEQAVARYRGARKELEQADLALSEAERREKAARRGVELGESDRTALTAARLESVGAARIRLEVLGRAQDALGDLETAIQKPLPSPAKGDRP